ncbi:hypothetical protein L207DRAFT_561564 [Hyaloscypha variabilis F]|uniref:Uncharacterized protein n=1 Tax=Hyaloscypha variabilis (strain UAMH 11265 / GT02V1 / F) TaxID=1149755 RepID=A0A2J6S5X6_HYAVF|nr:hypothetical protein L207DRAFT_561564 [Hyaloscypha variabilis F]
MADLHPIVIEPLEHTYKSIKYTCSGEGLYKDGYLYDAHAEKLIPPKTAKASAEPREIEKKPVAYWKAQCAFRGLNQSGSINDLQVRLREAKKKILPELKSAETELNKEFKKRNKAARDDSYKSLKTAEQKAKANPKKFLSEAFPKGGTGRPANLDIIVVKIGVDDRFVLANAAEAMGLETCSVDAPWTSNKKPSPDRWIIVGRTRDAVWNQMRDIEREAARSKQTFTSEKMKSQPLKQTGPKSTPKEKATGVVQNKVKVAPAPSITGGMASAPPRQVRPTIGPMHKGPRTLQTARKSVLSEPRDYGSSSPDADPTMSNSYQGHGMVASKSGFSDKPSPMKKEASSAIVPASGNSWDVRGSYKIKCPELEGGWSPQGDPTLTLDLYLETRQGKQQLYGIFHFRTVEGIMRFMKPIPTPKSESTGDSSKKRKHEDIGDNSDVDMDMVPEYRGNQGSNTYTEKVFFLGAKDRPTVRRPTWHYRWRGSDTSQGEIQLNSDKNVQSITFSKKGTELQGTIAVDFAGLCHFTGVKVHSHPRDPHVDPEAQWNNHGEEAYEYARKSRWR